MFFPFVFQNKVMTIDAVKVKLQVRTKMNRIFYLNRVCFNVCQGEGMCAFFLITNH